jgi:hypothetical protein
MVDGKRVAEILLRPKRLGKSLDVIHDLRLIRMVVPMVERKESNSPEHACESDGKTEEEYP